jgi:hypothetical protein
MANYKFRLAVSILVHENSIFFELQIKNLRNFYPDALVVVHSSNFFWNFNKIEIEDKDMIKKFTNDDFIKLCSLKNEKIELVFILGWQIK